MVTEACLIRACASGGVQWLGRRTCDQAVVGLIPGRAAIKLPRSTQPSIPLGWVNRIPSCLAGVMAGRVHLCRVAGNTV